MFTCLHAPHGRLRDQEGTDDVDLVDLTEQRRGGVEKRHVAADAGGVHEACNGCEAGFDLCDQLFDRSLVGDVHFGCHEFPLVDAGKVLLHRSLVAVGDHHPPSFGEQPLDAAEPDAGGPPGDDHRRVAQRPHASHGPFPLFRC
jgi:hypothetical protein